MSDVRRIMRWPLPAPNWPVGGGKILSLALVGDTAVAWTEEGNKVVEHQIVRQLDGYQLMDGEEYLGTVIEEPLSQYSPPMAWHFYRRPLPKPPPLTTEPA